MAIQELGRGEWVGAQTQQNSSRQITRHTTNQKTAKTPHGIQSCYHILSKMSSFQQKIMRHAKKQESVTHTQEDKESIEN